MDATEQDQLEVAELRRRFLAELNRDILPYWAEKMCDHERGGFYGRRDGQDNLIKDADKAIILNTRILWTFSQAGRQVDAKWIPVATRAFNYIVEKFVDRQCGGVYWMVDCNGVPSNTKKQVYAQAFCVYALSEYYMATGNEEALSLTKELFYVTEKYSFDSKGNGYLEAFDREWNLLEDLRLSEKDANEKKTMNTHLHVLEAYTNLYRCWKDEQLAQQLRNLILIFLDKIINRNWHLDLFFDDHWNVRSSHVSYGHDIEGSWLLQEAAEVLGDEALLSRVKGTAIKMIDVALVEGVDTDGAVWNEEHDHAKDWWPQAEGMVGFFNVWQLTGREQYRAAFNRVWKFIDDRIIDRQHGEWFWGLTENGDVNFSEDKAGPWKCPYHNGRAMMELLKRLPE